MYPELVCTYKQIGNYSFAILHILFISNSHYPVWISYYTLQRIFLIAHHKKTYNIQDDPKKKQAQFLDRSCKTIRSKLFCKERGQTNAEMVLRCNSLVNPNRTIITFPHSLMVQLSLPKKSSFLNMCACPITPTFLSSRQILFTAQTTNSISGFGSVLLCLSSSRVINDFFR